ncbi:unnamed protein product [Allacma fusca]|uniref:Copper type II ascorbate-dependent monooxygenase C-terminal domain-containing protein n=1 Tax=Allacma fusca TaxID=39272 RepID=A0A8J2JBG8_9HEXA|nr:unnamed protein product [Allacma fusca]
MYTATHLRKQDAGIIRIGYETGIGLMIPPSTSNYIVAGPCSATCTEDRVPDDGIQVFTLILHSHLAGRRMKLQILKGDHLTFECTYDSSHLTPPAAIRGGLSTRREICIAFLMYYPRMSRLDNWESSFYEETNLLKKLGIEGTDKFVILNVINL